MDTSRLKKFAQYARRSLIEQVQSKLKFVLAEDSAARREYPATVKKLIEKCKSLGKDQLIEQVAYTWFNRFCALRFMDVNQYNRIMVISPIAGQFQPEILAEAKAGHIDESLVNDKAREKIFGLLSGTVSSRDGQSEAYRLMIVAVCNDYHRLMPYLFERIEDYTELLMPDDLLSGNSILAYTRESMTPENCESVESIGWLYQFYISEKKDQVFADLKKNKKITPENIPAATQLFTPHWIVRYLVENSLGRLWMLNNPSSKVIEQMDYYIKPVEDNAEDDFLAISSPEELKICDPACGSGHMLTYAYDLLYAIYLDANYDPIDIPELILTKNLYGIEIDERAAELAAFALSMKAIKGNPLDDSINRRHFFRNPIKPNICRLEKLIIDECALEEYMEFVGNDLFTQDLRVTLKEFEEADNFGSLIQPTLTNVSDVLATLEAKDVTGQLFIADTHVSVLKVLKQANYLSTKYHAVIANPPYMGSGGMNPELRTFLSANYQNAKYDLMTCFMNKASLMALHNGYWAMINLPSWMFLDSFGEFRRKLLTTQTVSSLLHLGRGIFGSDFGSVAFVMKSKVPGEDDSGVYRKLFNKHVEVRSIEKIRQLFLDTHIGVYEFNQKNYQYVPSYNIAYWISNHVLNIFKESNSLGNTFQAKSGVMTGDDSFFLKNWYEPSIKRVGFGYENENDILNTHIFFPMNKEEGYRKWFGRFTTVFRYVEHGKEHAERQDINYRLRDKNLYFKKGISWGDVTSGAISFRYHDVGLIFAARAPTLFAESKFLLAFLNSNLSNFFGAIINPTLSFNLVDLYQLPLLNAVDTQLEMKVEELVELLLSLSKEDWNANELSWEFKSHNLLSNKNPDQKLEQVYNLSRNDELGKVKAFKSGEEEINRLLIHAYNLQKEVNENVLIKDVSLLWNPKNRYSSKRSDSELEALYKSDYFINFISFSIGCMFGRYSLDRAGLIIANHGDNIGSYIKQVPSPSFMPDEDNVIPIIDFEGNWFEDDITERLKTFLKVTFGEANFAENLTFIEEAIGKNIKHFFVKDFYSDHTKRYKKRPIYWLFSSPKGSFNALIYMHRYQRDTVSVVLNDYLREFRTKLEARKDSYEQVEVSASASQKDKTQAIKSITKINKVIDEINEYEHEILYPLAGKNIEIDLDNGVKHNYPLFGKALKKVTGLSQ